MSEYLDPVVIELEGRDQKLLDTLTRAKAEIRKFTDEVGRMNATVHVKVELADGEIRKIQERIGRINATIRVGLRLDQADRDRVDAQLAGQQFTASINPALDDEAVRRVEAALDHLTRARTVSIIADADTRAAADDLALLARARQARVTADADTRAAADDLDLLTRPRTVTIRTRVTGGNNPNTPNTPGSNRRGSDSDSKSPLDGGLLKALLPFAPALVPIAAEATAVTAAVGSATVALGAFGLAVKGQIGAAKGLSDAQGKYTQALAKYGPASQQASQAQKQWLAAVDAADPATRRAGVALQLLTQSYQEWSKSLAGDTMPVFTKGLAVAGALLPRLTPLAKGASVQLDRVVTALGGAISTPGFDRVMKRFSTFTNGVLKSGTDSLIHFMRVLSQGGGSGAFSQFMAYAKQNAPLVKDTLKNLSEAILNILKAASQAGPGMLSLVNALAKIVAALPPSVLATILQVIAAFKLLALTKTGVGALSTTVQGLSTRFTAMRTAASGATGGLARLRAAFSALSVAGKATVIIAAIAAVTVAIAKLASLGQQAPPDVDKLTNSLGRLGQNGQVKGEALKDFGKNLSGLRDSIKSFVAPSVIDNIQQGLVKVLSFGTTDSTPYKEAKQSFDAIDQSLANLVQNGNADLAAAALERMKKAYSNGGKHDVSKFTGSLKEYKKAVDDAKFAQELAAESQGLFGQQALKVQAALDKQKAAAQGLQQAILDLNDTNRNALDTESAYQQAIDDATAAIKGHRDALHMSNGQLDLNSKAAREAYQPLSQLAASAEESAKATLVQTGSQDKANRVLIDAHAQLVRVARQMGLNSSEANTLADMLDNIKDPKIQVTVKAMQAEADLRAFNAAVKAAPGAKQVTLKTLSSTAEKVLETFGYHVTHMKDGSVKVTAKTGSALGAIGDVAAAVSSLDGRTATITVMVNHQAISVDPKQYYSYGPHATGGLLRRASGGAVQTFPAGGYIEGPGTPTSDSILAMFASGATARVSDSEYVVRAAAVKKYGVGFMDALNSGRLKVAGFANGGLSQAAKDARSQLGYGLGISYFGRLAGYQGTSVQHSLGTPADLGSLVSSLNDLRSQIKAAFNGKTESSLLKQLDKAGKSLIGYDKQLTKVTSSLESAKSKLDDLKNSAAQLRQSVASSILQGSSVVTQAPQEGFALSSQDVLNNLRDRLAKTQQFSSELETLKKRGLSADLLEQLASAGVDQGGATAAALVGSSDATIKQLNSIQSKLKSSADKAGAAVSDAMYGAGIHAAEGLVKGLEKQQKAIEAAMLRIAKSMEAAIKKALGIKSPSTVMAKLGDHTAQGFALGIARSAKHARIAAEGMAMSVQQGATVTGAPAWTASLTGRGGTVVHHHHHFEPHITVEGNVRTIDGLAKDIEAAFLRRGARNPVTYQPYKR